MRNGRWARATLLLQDDPYWYKDAIIDGRAGIFAGELGMNVGLGKALEGIGVNCQ
jgi:hypothetical protein